MIIRGHGVDVVDIGAFRRLLDDPDGEFLHRCFTQAEQHALKNGPHEVEQLAGIFAAKEAVAKALGTGFDERVSPLDIEIRHLPSGAPTVVVSGSVSALAAPSGRLSWYLSIAHTDTVAIASVIALIS